MSIFILSIIITPKAKALTTINASDETGNVTVESNENINDNLATAGNNVYIRGIIEDDLFVAGSNINIEGEIKGNLFAAGNMVTINGKIHQDAFVAGNNVTFGENTSVGRDLYTAGNLLNINGEIGRNLMVGSAMLNLNAIVNGNTNAQTSSLKLGENASILGSLTYTGDTKIDTNNEQVKGEISYQEPEKNTNNENNNNVSSIFTFGVIFNWIRSLLSFIAIGILLVLLMPKWFDKIGDIIAKNTLKSMGIGFLILIVAPIAAIIAIFTIIGIPITIIITLLYILILYIAKYWVAYCLGKYIGKGKWSPIATIAIGALILQIIFIIPFIGGLASFLTMLAGTGAIWLANPMSSAKK